MNNTKRKVKTGRIVIFFIAVVVVAVAAFFILKGLISGVGNIISPTDTAYIAATTKEIKLYDESFNETGMIPRGSEVKLYRDVITNETNQAKYQKITYNKKDYLIVENSTAKEQKDTVLEKTMYVRTPLTVYKNATDPSILGMHKKGEAVEILGFDKLLSDGSVNMYQIKYQDASGYLYAKYMETTKELALLNYDADGKYKTHAARKNTQGGGSGANLDYFPYEKPQFTDNVMPKEVRSLYLNAGVLGNVDDYIKLAKDSNINAFVVDIKDNTVPGYASDVMKELSPTNYAKAYNSKEKYQQAIKKLKDNGFYVIGRITTFKDNYYAKDHPESTIIDTRSNSPFNHDGAFWPSGFRRDVWEFTVRLAIEAVEEMGFDEIQFDYVRFPDRTQSYEKQGVMNFQNSYDEEKAQAIQGFLLYASDQIHQHGAYVSADVFGESAHNYVTAYGQYWPAISNVVDVISGMPYPDHFSKYEYDFDEPVWTVPYKLLNFWGSKFVAIRQTEIPTPAVVRTWIQAYDTTKSPATKYDASKVSDEIKGLYDAGLTGGYMTWNSGSNISHYTELAPAFRKNYLQ